MKIDQALTFDDVQLVPNYSEIESRLDVTTQAALTRNFKLDIPLVAAPMSTVCGFDMAVELMQRGAVGALHRFNTIEQSATDVRHLASRASRHGTSTKKKIPVVASIGATGDYQARAEALLTAGANVLLIDVAHGDHIHVKRAIQWLNGLFDRRGFDIIAGNVATAKGARRLEEWGADAVRVGIGGGSMCETRIRTGVGVPQLQAVIDVIEDGAPLSVPVISDGGIRHPGDVTKALAAGADTVMIGSLFAGTDESPGKVLHLSGNTAVKVFQGSASIAQKGSDYNVEGASTLIPLKGPVQQVVRSIMEGVRSSMSYVGASHLDEFYGKARFIQITSNGLAEAHPHGVR
jgi:IMP dehydrogenase